MRTRTVVDPEHQVRVARARELRGAGLTHAAIALEVGRSRSWVTKYLAEPGALTPYQRNVVPARVKQEGSRAVVAVARAPEGGRLTSMGMGAIGTSRLQAILPPPDYRSRWISKGLDMSEWDRMSSSELIRILRHVSPDVSRAVWDWNRLLNPGYELTAYKVGTERKTPDDRAQAALNAFVDDLEEHYGSLKVQFGRGFMNALMRGSILAELVTDARGRVPVDLVVPDPVTIRFRQGRDPVRGTIWEKGQWQNGEFVSLEYPTIKYVAVDPESDNPYGTAMLGSAIFPCLFLIGLLHDLRRVVAQQGYPRTHIQINLEQLRAAFSQASDTELEAKIAELQDDIAEYYGTLQPDDAFITTTSVDVNTNGGAIATQVLASAAALIDVLERMAMRALKSMPLLMGLTEGTSEANANRQWEIFAEGINSLQQDAENLFGALFQIALEIQGIQCEVELRFAKLRAAEEARDEQTFKLRLENAQAARDAGFWSQEQASLHAVHEPPAEEEAPAPAPAPVPDATPGEGDQPPADAQAEDGDLGNNSVARPWSRLTPEEKREVRRRLADLGVTRAVDISKADDAAVDEAVAIWEDVFAGERVADLLRAEVVTDGD